MKKFYLVFVVIFIFSCDRTEPYGPEVFEVPPPSFEIELPDGVEYGTSSSNFIFVKSHVKSNSDVPLDITWKLVEWQYTHGWILNVCDPINCWPPEIRQNTFTLPPRAEGLLDAGFKPQGLMGDGYAKLLVWGNADSLETVQYVEFFAETN